MIQKHRRKQGNSYNINIVNENDDGDDTFAKTKKGEK
jgi:hypothetical protein